MENMPFFIFTFYKCVIFLGKHYPIIFFPNMEYFNKQMFSQLPVKLMVKMTSVEFHLHCIEQGDIQ